MVKRLLATGVEVNVKDKHGNTALTYATQNGNITPKPAWDHISRITESISQEALSLVLWLQSSC